jgi:transcriptional regulator with XRE-family HTH domain
MGVTQLQIAQRIGIDVSTVNKILNRRKGPVFKKDTIKRVFKAARELGYDLDRLKYQHRRLEPRKKVHLPLELSIYFADGTLFDRGRAVMRDVSLSGALLSGVVLTEKRGIPLEPHTIAIRLLEGPLKDLEIRGKPVRFLDEGDAIYVAIAFEQAQAATLKKLRKIV